MDLNNIPPVILTSGVWLWENFGKQIIEKSFKSVGSRTATKWREFKWAEAAKNYRQKVYDQYSKTRMLGNPHPVPLEGIFTDLYILDKPSAYRRYDISMLRKEHYKFSDLYSKEKRVKALSIVSRQDRLFILGKPGAGKTTLMKYLTLLASRGQINRVPIFVSLNDWAQSKLSLERYIEKQFEICAFPNAWSFIDRVLLSKGRAMVLFDGLDEVNEENNKRAEIIWEMNCFIKKYSIRYKKVMVKTDELGKFGNEKQEGLKRISKQGNKFFITCRVAATEYLFDDFPYVEIADFNWEQIITYVQKWFNTQPEKGKRFVDDLSKDEHIGLRELAQTPILLSLLCLNYDETLTFPNRRAEIYQEAIDVLLKKWDATRNIKRDVLYRTLSPVRKQQLFSRIAAEYFQQKEIFFNEDDLAKKISDFLSKLPAYDVEEPPDGFVVLKSIEAQHGLLVERAHNIHSFSHLNLQEYFTSRYIVDHISDGSTGRLIKNVSDNRWREVLILTASLLSNANDFFADFQTELKRLRDASQVICKLLKWAEKKSKDYAYTGHPIVAKMMALALPLSIEFDGIFQDNYYIFTKYVKDLAYSLDKKAFSTLDLDLILDKEPSRVLDNMLLRTLQNAIILVRESKRDENRDFLVDFDFALDRSISIAENIGDEGLLNSLRIIPRSFPDAKKINWKNQVDLLRPILIRYRNIGHEWKLNPRQKDHFRKYLDATLRMAECLHVAFVDDRKSIGDKLLST